MMRRLFVTLLATVFGLTAFAQFNNSGIVAGFFDSSEEQDINFSEFHLPPLAVLFENAKATPAILKLEKAREMAEAEVAKQKKHIFSYLRGNASYSYGRSDVWSMGNDYFTTTPVQFQGSDQSYWNVGVSLNLPLEDILDLSASVRRKRLEVDMTVLSMDEAYDQLKKQIATLYTKITNDLVALKTASENAAMYQGAGALSLQEFHNGNMDITEFAHTKTYEQGAVSTYQNLQTSIITDIITLEILTHTPIITNTTTEITLDSSGTRSKKEIRRENRQVERRVRRAVAEEQRRMRQANRQTPTSGN